METKDVILELRTKNRFSQEALAGKITLAGRRCPVGKRGFPKRKDTTTKPTLTLLPNNIILKVHPMKRLLSCEYYFGNCLGAQFMPEITEPVESEACVHICCVNSG